MGASVNDCEGRASGVVVELADSGKGFRELDGGVDQLPHAERISAALGLSDVDAD
jgi:hypothetical protein